MNADITSTGDKQKDDTWTEVCYTVEVSTKGFWRWATNYLGINRRFYTIEEAEKALTKNYLAKKVAGDYRIVQVVTTFTVAKTFNQ